MTTRKPCKGWRQHGTAAHIMPLDGDSVSDCRLWAVVTNGRNGAVTWQVSMQSFDDDDAEVRVAAGRVDDDVPVLEAVESAMFAAEDAARALLLAGLAVLDGAE